MSSTASSASMAAAGPRSETAVAGLEPQKRVGIEQEFTGSLEVGQRGVDITAHADAPPVAPERRALRRLLDRAQFGPDSTIFNVLNTVNPDNPVATLSSPDFGRIVALAPGRAPRIMQLAVKYIF